MDSIADEAKLSSRPEGKKNRGAPVPDLLEEAWFFRKFIDGTTAAAAAKPAVRSMGRCFSDPTSSQSVSIAVAAPQPQSGGLARAPSLPPPCVGRRSGEVGCCRKSAGRSKVGDFKTGGGGREEMMMKKGKRGSRSEKGRNPGSLERAPSLPPWIGRSEEEVEEGDDDDDESDMSMSRLIQQAMSCSLDDISIPKPTISSASKMNSRITHSSTMKTDVRDGSNYSRRRIIPVSNDVVANSSQTKSVSDVHQGRKLKKTLSNLEIPRQRPNNNNGCSPPIPTWAEDPNAHMSENIKAHLKVWARSVAANIH
ncbi:hypothetical protein LINGRAHAP2_LOCUS16910 [Linum grandiflorum]